MRFKKAQNVVESEELYVKRMTLMRDNFMGQLKKLNILGQDDLRLVFSETETICGIHGTMLDQLRKALGEAGSQSADHSTFKSMAQVFVTMASFLKVTIPYVRNFSAARQRLTQLTNENSAFKSFLQVCACVVQPIHRVSQSNLGFFSIDHSGYWRHLQPGC